MKKFNLQLMIIFSLSLFVLLFFSPDLFAQKQFEGWWESETISITSSQIAGKIKNVEHDKFYYKKGKMKQVNIESNSIEIVRLDLDLMWSLNPENKTYTETKFEDVENSMKEIREQMAEKMSKLSEKDREMMKQMLGDKMSSMFAEKPQLSFKVTGKKKKISGFDCKQVLMLLNNSPLMELWVTDKYYMGEDFLKYYEKTGLIRGKIPETKELKGFIIYSKMENNTPMGNTITEDKVTKIVQTKISDKEFEIPAGYKKVAQTEF